MWMKMRLKHWWYGAVGGQKKNSEKTLSKCHTVHHKPQYGLAWDRTLVSAMSGGGINI
jgi:hypothetical protein